MQKREIDQQVEHEIADQPRALNELMRCYASPEGRGLLDRIPQGGRVLFTGMGASFHAAMIGADLCRAEGVDGSCAPASEVIGWPIENVNLYDRVIYLSQSGASGEVLPLLEKADHSRLIAITNNPDSPLGKSAALTLPLCAGEENWIASKTYLNSLALLRLVTGCLLCEPTDLDPILDEIKKARQRSQVILEARVSLSQRWLSLIGAGGRLVNLGSGLQAISARQSALMLAEWAKQSSLACSIDEFRHGLIESIDQDAIVLVFQSSCRQTAFDDARIDQLHETGARVIRVRDGLPLAWGEPVKPATGIEYSLSPLLDATAAQTLCLSLAARNDQTGFRFIQKIVK